MLGFTVFLFCLLSPVVRRLRWDDFSSVALCKGKGEGGVLNNMHPIRGSSGIFKWYKQIICMVAERGLFRDSLVTAHNGGH